MRLHRIKLHHKIAGFFGYELIKQRKLHDTLEQHLAKLLTLLKINCVVDAGANVGDYGKVLRQLGYTGRIVSFEPLKDVHAQLELAISNDPLWSAHQLALGRENKRQMMNSLQSSVFSSLHAPSAYGKRRFKSRMNISNQEDVRVTTLSELWPEIIHGLNEPRVFLKMDTQGFDLEVLAGAGEGLRHVVGLQSEISLKPIYENAPFYLQSLTEFDRLGFEVTGLYPVTRDRKTLAVIEFDCVTRRKQSIDK